MRHGDNNRRPLSFVFRERLASTKGNGMSIIPLRQLTYRSVTDLIANKRNPRKHSSAQIEAIAKSIQAFGFNAPILLDRNARVIAGHGRLAAAKLLQLDSVPTIGLDELSDEQARAYMLADNKLTDRSTWDDQLLAEYLKELSELTISFDIDATGFELPEIDIRIQSLSLDEPEEPQNIIVKEGPAVSKLGDLWLLGEHKIYCGSALDPTTYETLMGPDKAKAVFADFPYNVKIDGNVTGAGNICHREFPMASGEMSSDAFTKFLGDALDALKRYTATGGLVYACMDWRHLTELLAASAHGNFDLLNLCVWVKTNGGMGSFYRSQHELILLLKNGSAPHKNNVQLGRFGRNRTNVWHYPGSNTFPRKGEKSTLSLHPTVKPLALVSDAILDSTSRSDLVLDPFLGSGTTILAAQNTGRRGVGIELDPLYVDTAIARWQRLTSKTAKHSCGASFDEVAARRGVI